MTLTDLELIPAKTPEENRTGFLKHGEVDQRSNTDIDNPHADGILSVKQLCRFGQATEVQDENGAPDHSSLPKSTVAYEINLNS